MKSIKASLIAAIALAAIVQVLLVWVPALEKLAFVFGYVGTISALLLTPGGEDNLFVGMLTIGVFINAIVYYCVFRGIGWIRVRSSSAQ